jgi:hypothetical protein
MRRLVEAVAGSNFEEIPCGIFEPEAQTAKRDSKYSLIALDS